MSSRTVMKAPRRHDGGEHRKVGPASAIEGGLIRRATRASSLIAPRACVVTSEEYASKKGLKPLGRFLGFAVAGCGA